MRKSILIITALLMTKTKTTITYLMVVITILFLSCTSKQQSEVPTGEMFDEATVSFAKAYTFLRKWMETDTTGKDMPRIILRLDNIATSYIHTSEYAKAKMWLDREDSALAIYSQKPNVVEKQTDFLKGTIQLDLAAMCQQLGQSEEAARHYDEHRKTVFSERNVALVRYFKILFLFLRCQVPFTTARRQT